LRNTTEYEQLPRYQLLLQISGTARIVVNPREASADTLLEAASRLVTALQTKVRWDRKIPSVVDSDEPPDSEIFRLNLGGKIASYRIWGNVIFDVVDYEKPNGRKYFCTEVATNIVSYET
jgi:hypothetical protein